MISCVWRVWSRRGTGSRGGVTDVRVRLVPVLPGRVAGGCRVHSGHPMGVLRGWAAPVGTSVQGVSMFGKGKRGGGRDDEFSERELAARERVDPAPPVSDRVLEAADRAAREAARVAGLRRGGRG